MNDAPVFPFVIGPLRYDDAALEPFLSRQALLLHRMHHQAYMDRLNRLLQELPSLHGQSIESILRAPEAIPEAARAQVLFEGGGHANHQFLWKILARGEGQLPGGALADAIDEQYGGLDRLKTEFNRSAMQLDAQGWTFLVVNHPPHGALEVVSLRDNQSVLSIGKAGILCCDLWPHAYEQQYRVDRQRWLDAFWEMLAWDVATRRYEGIRAGAKVL
jgi:Fe-Mn family superoxide dismutase